MQACGEVVEDTYDEYVPGAVAAAFALFTGQQQSSQASRQSATGGFIQQCRICIKRRLEAVATSLSVVFAYFRRGEEEDDGPMGHPSTDVEMEQHDSNSKRYLFVCLTQWRRYYRTKMVPICMNIGCDDDMFLLLRKRFEKSTGHWRRAVGFKRLTDIRFVKVSFPALMVTVTLMSEIVPNYYSPLNRNLLALRNARPNRRGLPASKAS